jgi:hypothetical protein
LKIAVFGECPIAMKTPASRTLVRARARVLDRHARDAGVSALDVGDRRVELPRDLRVVRAPVEHDPRRAELLAPVDDRDLDANLVRKVASSIAVSPPPTTTTSLPLKKKPSHVAHADTPRPIIRFSASSPRSFADAPEETIDGVGRDGPAAVERQPERVPEKSTFEIVSSTTSVPKRRACSRKISMSSGPWMPSRKPG